jgi:uncharacterized protein YndB with AHSA1/START domain
MTTTTTDRGFTLTRILNAPPATVWRAWTEPEHLRWFLNPGFGAPDAPITVDLRVGGAFRVHMIVNDELEYMTGGIYREIVPTERLAFEWGAIDGWPLLDPAVPDDAPLTILEFIDNGDGTTEQRLQVAFPAAMPDARVADWLASGMREGWGSTIDRLVALYS